MAKKLTKDDFEMLKKSFAEKKVAFTEQTIHKIKTKKKIYYCIGEVKR